MKSGSPSIGSRWSLLHRKQQRHDLLETTAARAIADLARLILIAISPATQQIAVSRLTNYFGARIRLWRPSASYGRSVKGRHSHEPMSNRSSSAVRKITLTSKTNTR